MRSPGFLGLIYDRYWPCNICGDHIGVIWRLGVFYSHFWIRIGQSTVRFDR